MTSRTLASLIILLSLAVSGLLPGTTLAATQKSAKTPPMPTATTTVSTWSFDRSRLDVPVGTKTQQEVKYDPDKALNVFRVANDRLYKNEKWTEFHADDEQKVWYIFHAMAGKDFIKKNVNTYATYKIPDEPILGFVFRNGTKEPSWVLAVNTNASNFSDKVWTRDMMVVLVHEYGHLLTLNTDQLNVKNASRSVCERSEEHFVIPETGCSLTGSYIEAYMRQFWNSNDRTAAAAAESKGASDDFYAKHKGEFVTKYAATNPEEDIAESFADFVLRFKPTGTQVKDQKVLFFYGYPELVTLRDTIRAAIGPYMQ